MTRQGGDAGCRPRENLIYVFFLVIFTPAHPAYYESGVYLMFYRCSLGASAESQPPGYSRMPIFNDLITHDACHKI